MAKKKKEKPKLKRKAYEKKLAELHFELVKMHNWIKDTGRKLVLIFEGRDAAGKGGAVKAINEPLNPRGSRVVALGTPSDRETSGTSSATSPTCPPPARFVLLDRSWYNCAGVEHVMGFCTDDEYKEFMRTCPSLSGCWSAQGSRC